MWTDEESRAGFVAGNAQRQVLAENRGMTFTGDMSLEILYASVTESETHTSRVVVLSSWQFGPKQGEAER